MSNCVTCVCQFLQEEIVDETDEYIDVHRRWAPPQAIYYLPLIQWRWSTWYGQEVMVGGLWPFCRLQFFLDLFGQLKLTDTLFWQMAAIVAVVGAGFCWGWLLRIRVVASAHLKRSSSVGRLCGSVQSPVSQMHTFFSTRHRRCLLQIHLSAQW